jgi:hypothetical protein
MIKNIDCPICFRGKLQINVANGYKVVTSGHLKDLPCIAYCKNCNRKIKYSVVSEKQDN